ncbi:MAG TPA: XrtN system VIT domain-containing protein, partial [Niastella sp.]
MNLYNAKKSDTLFITGLLLILLSLVVYSLPVLLPHTADNFGLFICNYAITVAYFIILIASKRLKKGREGFFVFFLFLILLLISAYALNREIVVFEKAVPWFVILQVILCINYISFAFFPSCPRWLQLIMSFLLGVALVTFFYMTCYLVPMYGLSVMASFVLGISMHSFVGLLFLIYTIVLLRKVVAGRRIFLYSFIGGAGVSVSLIIAFVIQWGLITSEMNKTYRLATVDAGSGWPAWVSVAQKAPHNGITEQILKSDLVYSTSGNMDNFLWSMPSRSFGEEKKHDPLIMIASFFTGKVNIDEETRIKLLESMYDSRHQAQERLWSDEHLYTEHINSAVRIWPQFGISYTEKVITVSNAALKDRWGGDQEEAIYTFHLPEGAVVTSLSLWIEGKEAPGILTTKQKADSAYKQIVGGERRDPSVLHWLEGNTVSVRVFPVVAGESRKFKVGITAPLTRDNGKMKYENIYFDGPTVAQATEDASLQFQQPLQNFIAPAVFTPKGHQTFSRSGKYDPSWDIELPDQALSNEAFCFDGKQYTIRPYQKQRTPATIKTVYLDVNGSWTKDEFNTVYNAVKGKQVFVYDNELVQVTDENKASIYHRLHSFQFSLFPVFLITDANTSLLVSKSNMASPNMNDLEGSDFLIQVKKSVQGSKKWKLFNIGNTLSPYLKTLKEYRVFQYEHGTVNELKGLIDKQEFAKDIEHDKQVVIDNAEIAIVEDSCATSSTAPDHLLRLFAYNHIMQKMGPSFSGSEEIDEALVAEAQKAYVVSPVSSLVVLETQKDYDRFNISDSQNSLKNAS